MALIGERRIQALKMGEITDKRKRWCQSYSVPKFIDLCVRRHPVMNNFPLSHVIFKVNFLLSNDPLILVSAKRQLQRHNTGLSLKSTRLSSFIEFISHILLRVFHSSWLFNTQIFHSDTQAVL